MATGIFNDIFLFLVIRDIVAVMRPSFVIVLCKMIK
jgi:hypothetical protein